MHSNNASPVCLQKSPSRQTYDDSSNNISRFSFCCLVCRSEKDSAVAGTQVHATTIKTNLAQNQKDQNQSIYFAFDGPLQVAYLRHVVWLPGQDAAAALPATP
jgi:hypothetical protein